MQATQKVLDFIKAKKLEPSQYHTLVFPLQEKFVITNRDNLDRTEYLIKKIVDWEESKTTDSLDTFLNNYFIIKEKE